MYPARSSTVTSHSTCACSLQDWGLESLQVLHMHTEDWVSCSTGGAEGTTGAVVEKERRRLLRLLIVTVSLKSLESRKASIRDLDILTGDADLVSLETACLDLVHCTDLMT